VLFSSSAYLPVIAGAGYRARTRPRVEDHADEDGRLCQPRPCRVRLLRRQGGRATGGAMAGGLYLSLPMYMEGASLLDVMKIDLPLVGMVQGLADAAREVDIGGGNEDTVNLLLDLHDAM
jgi:hypothetical protein